MMSKKVIALTLSLLMMSSVTAFAKGNDGSHGKAAQAVQATQSSKPQNLVKQNDDKDETEKDDENEVETSDIQQNAATVQATAEADSQQKGKGLEHKQAAEQNKAEKKQQIEAFKTAMKAKHATMAQLRQQIAAVRTEVEQKKAQLAGIVAELQAGTKTLPQDMLTQLLAASQNIQLDVTEVQLTSEVQTEAADTQDKVKKSDFNNALASMDKVIAKFQARLDALKKLNSDLDTALSVANLAAAPTTTPTDSTSAPADNTTTGSTATDNTTPTGTTTDTTGTTAASSSSTDSSATTGSATSTDNGQTTGTSTTN
ncbi:MAG: hypothetical protein Q8930_10135 [Bacillota bacterium]|nr:hypothetical protein [Bacillota bacterium]